MKLTSHAILIVESEVGHFARNLQAAIERTGAQSLIARDVAAALDRLKVFEFSAAVINIEHRALIDELSIPVLLYGPNALPAKPDMLVSRLKRLLGH